KCDKGTGGEGRRSGKNREGQGLGADQRRRGTGKGRRPGDRRKSAVGHRFHKRKGSSPRLSRRPGYEGHPGKSQSADRQPADPGTDRAVKQFPNLPSRNPLYATSAACSRGGGRFFGFASFFHRGTNMV